MKKIIYAFLLTVVSAIGLSSCSDERLWIDDDIIGEGEATISAEVLFKNFTSALDGNASRTAGNVLDGIENLYLFVYSADGQELLYNTSFAGDDLDVSKTNTTLPSDGQYEPAGSAVTPTERATFNCNLPFGRYQIYAVANVRGENVEKLSADKVGTVDDLKAVSFNWNEGDIPANDQMFGFFTTNELSQSPASTFDAPTITVNNSNIKLNAWMRRLGSKVTVAFDGTNLKESVYIYIQSVTLHDIPASCTIGKSNTPDALDQLIHDGESITYNEVEENQTRPGLVISKNRKAGSTGHTHEDKNSLFFYENDQGDKSMDPNKDWYNKIQPADKVGTSINEPLPDDDHASGINDYKDRVPNGTYIEVKAYYKSDNKEKPSEGDIIYRFMLGKDITYNYDAERNYHFKLTLKFNNWANDPDWHIVYDEPTPSVYTPNIYYISYLYNQQMSFPVRVVTGDGESVKKYTLHSEIIANNWGPSEDDPENENDYGDVPDQWSPAYSQASVNNRNGFAWNKPAFDGDIPNAYNAEEVTINNGRKIKAGANFVGFLTLRQNENTVVGNGLAYADAETPAFLKAVYNGEPYTTASGVSNTVITTPRWWAEYKLNEEGRHDVCGNAGDGQYDVTYHTDGSVTANVPMYTRAKEIVPATDFTGNNPYDAYMRLAFVKFTLKDEEGKEVEFKNIDDLDGPMIKERIVPIYQVRRINNPKAIWRKSGSVEPFHVELMQRANESTNTFVTFKSRGPWRAYILQDPKGIVKLTAGSQSVTGVMDLDSYDQPKGTNMITGDGGTAIDFTYTPSGADGCAIIRVDYHDYTCHHLIFVRSGYDYGVTLGKAKWSCYNVYATTAQNGSPTETVSSVNVELQKVRFP